MRHLRPLSFFLFLTLLPPLSAVEPSDLAPPDTIFYCEVPSVASFYTLFLKDHNESIRDPLVAKAVAGRVESLLAKRSLAPFTVPIALNANAAFYATGQTSIFIASVADQEGALTFIGGGLAPDPEQSIAKLRSLVETQVDGLVWHNEEIEKTTVQTTEIVGIGKVYLTSSAGWLLFGTSRPGLEHALRALAQPLPGLASTDLWKEAAAKRPSDTQLYYFTRVSAYAELARKRGRADVQAVFETRLGGIRGFAWSWATKGPGTVAADTMIYLLSPEAAEPLRKICQPLGPGWRVLAGPDTTGLAALKFDAQSLAAAPALKGLPIEPLLNAGATILKTDATPLHCGWISDFDPTTRKPCTALAVRADEKNVRTGLAAMPGIAVPRDKGYELFGQAFATYRDGTWFVTQTAAEAEYFRTRKTEKSPVILNVIDKMPQVAKPFWDLRLDRVAIAGNYASRLRANYAAWSPILAKRGVELPATLPEIDFASYMGPFRSTAAFEGDHLVICNAFQLGKETGSTLITAQAELVEAAYRPQIEMIFDKGDRLTTPLDTPAAPSLFSICLKTNFICTALFQPNQNSVFTDLFTASFLSAAPDPSDN